MKTFSKTRRGLLQGAGSCGLLASSGWPVSGLLASDGLSNLAITDRITLITGAGGNVTLYRGSRGLTLIDSGLPESAQALVGMLDTLGGRAPVANLFNTHWHDAHTGGNEAIHALGADIIAHENTRLWLGADFDVEWRNTSHRPRPADALPTSTFYESTEKELGGETVQVHFYPRAHTDGDIVLFFPDSNVLVSGGLVTDGTYPICDIATGGWIGELVSANEAMLSLANDATVIIPDRGMPRSKADLQAQHAMLSDLYGKMKALAQEGYSGRDMLEAGVTADYDARWGDPAKFVLETYRGMWAHTYDMGGFI